MLYWTSNAKPIVQIWNITIKLKTDNSGEIWIPKWNSELKLTFNMLLMQKYERGAWVRK